MGISHYFRKAAKGAVIEKVANHWIGKEQSGLRDFKNQDLKKTKDF